MQKSFIKHLRVIIAAIGAVLLIVGILAKPFAGHLTFPAHFIGWGTSGLTASTFLGIVFNR